jgi:hypothetical protein
MSARAHTSADQAGLERAWGRDAARLLSLLRRNRDAGVTVAEMRERGIDAPAQAIYTLQLAGYAVDHVPAAPNGSKARAYRMRGGPRYLEGRSSETGNGDEL